MGFFRVIGPAVMAVVFGGCVGRKPLPVHIPSDLTFAAELFAPSGASVRSLKPQLKLFMRLWMAFRLFGPPTAQAVQGDWCEK